VGLVGYSFGAGLPDDVRAAVVEVSPLGLEPRAPFEIAVSGWLGGVPADAPPVLPELARLDLSRVQCFYGEEEELTLCTDPALEGAEIIRTTGGHHFDGDYEALARRILEGAERRAGSRPAG
jgi:type IV secretory pathway VirJ component